MGKRGPPPTPTAILKTRGSWRANLRTDEPVPPSAEVTPPDFLDEDAIKEWNRLVPILQHMGLMTIADISTLARYCNLLVRYWKLNAFVAKNGEFWTVKDDNGKTVSVRAFPHIAQMERMLVQLLRLEQQFGLTPSARSGLHVTAAWSQSGKPKTEPTMPAPVNRIDGERFFRKM